MLTSFWSVDVTQSAFEAERTAVYAAGKPVTTLAAPLEVVISNPPAGYIPAISSDGGVTFRALSELCGTTLPADQQDGFLRTRT